jgi:hypothetical protein
MSEYRHIPLPDDAPTVHGRHARRPRGSRKRKVVKWFVAIVLSLMVFLFTGIIGFLLWSVVVLAAMGYDSRPIHTQNRSQPVPVRVIDPYHPYDDV